MRAVEYPIGDQTERRDCGTASFHVSGAQSSRHWSNLDTRRHRFTKHCTTVVLVCVVLLFPSFGFAQKVITASASIPFDFWVQGHVFRAGEYAFDSGFPGATTIRRKGSNSSFAISIIPYGDSVKRESAKVLFVNRDGKYYLTEFWGVLDRRVVTSEFEHRGEVSEQQHQVPLIYP